MGSNLCTIFRDKFELACYDSCMVHMFILIAATGVGNHLKCNTAIDTFRTIYPNVPVLMRIDELKSEFVITEHHGVEEFDETVHDALGVVINECMEAQYKFELTEGEF